MIDAAIARVLVEASLRVCFVALAVAVVLRAARVQSSTVRHAAWASVVVAMLLMPLLPYVLPSFVLGRSGVAATLNTMAAFPDDLPYIGSVDLRESFGSAAPFDVMTSPEAGAFATRTIAVPTSAVGATYFSGMPKWLLACAVIYAIGFGMLLVRWVLAARFLARLRRQCTPIAMEAGDVYESPLAATPITVGAWHPRIVLPLEWRHWSPEKLAGVLAHERAHVARRDPLTALIAYVNRCIFWFHPLAWWLERTLAATAEDAADDAGVRAMGQEREYAAVLVEMAEVVRRHGGRVAWQGVGVDGNGLLTKRIDRLLGGLVFREVSRMKKILIAVVCALAVCVAVACRPNLQAAALKPDPAVTAELASSLAHAEKVWALQKISVDQVQAMESQVQQHPEDLETRGLLVSFYRGPGIYRLGSPRAHVGLRKHVLWLIEHHPEAKETANALLIATPGPVDDSGYAEGRALWLAQLERPDFPAAAYSNAIGYLSVADIDEAERVAVKARALEPQEPRRTNALADVYVKAITGSRRQPGGGITPPDPASFESSVALRVRKELDESTDAALLAATGRELARVSQFGPDALAPERAPLDTLGRAYVARAVAIDPTLPSAQMAATQLRYRELQRRAMGMAGHLGGGVSPRRSPSEQYALIMAMPEPERFPLMAWLSDTAYMAGDLAINNSHDAAAANAAWDVARQAADAALALAPKYRDDADWSSNVFGAHVALALVALRHGDVPTAVKEMNAAGAVPSSPAFMVLGEYNQLAWTLLECGERDSVAAFYERIAALSPGGSTSALDAAKAVRAGLMPRAYQQQRDYLARTANPASNPFTEK
jgi:Zn-dependent protease with chaperone function/tetratricopeptide (TPR) repeat protein